MQQTIKWELIVIIIGLSLLAFPCNSKLLTKITPNQGSKPVRCDVGYLPTNIPKADQQGLLRETNRKILEEIKTHSTDKSLGETYHVINEKRGGIEKNEVKGGHKHRKRSISKSRRNSLKKKNKRKNGVDFDDHDRPGFHVDYYAARVHPPRNN